MTDQDTLHSLPTVKAPTLPTLLTEQIETDRRLSALEQGQNAIVRSQWYLITLLAFLELIAVASVAGVMYLIGHMH